ncbi:MAG: histidine--tRNA ligase [Candidatus Riflebacteria bacterium]|nr:histidine--tRNA ligase [Candidatus Riflebacteria bacterium]
MMGNISTNPPSGMRDFSGKELAARRYIEKIIREVYELYGFIEIETPAIENLSTLLGKYGEEGDQLIFRILHRREKLSRALEGKPSEADLADIGLRYDLTVPLARFVANNKDLPKFFRRYQIQSVWRADRPGKGRFREFCQCDIDITGTESLTAEAEVCGAVSGVLKRVGLEDFYFHVNHRQLLKRMIAYSGISDSLEETALVALDKLDKIGTDGVVKELRERNISDESTKKLIELTSSVAEDNHAELERLRKIFAADEIALKCISELADILAFTSTSESGKRLKIDCSLARGLGYYTGPIFEIRVHDLKGSLGGGGRYDNLIGMFKGSRIPAVGFSIGFERLILLAEERKLLPDLMPGADILLCRFPDVEISKALEVADHFRNNGIKAEVYPDATKLGKQLSYATEIKASYAGIIGADELKDNKITIKRLSDGEQLTLPLCDAPGKVKAGK